MFPQLWEQSWGILLPSLRPVAVSLTHFPWHDWQLYLTMKNPYMMTHLIKKKNSSTPCENLQADGFWKKCREVRSVKIRCWRGFIGSLTVPFKRRTTWTCQPALTQLTIQFMVSMYCTKKTQWVDPVWLNMCRKSRLLMLHLPTKK